MTTIFFQFFTDATTGNPAFSPADAPVGNPFGWRPLMSMGMGA